MSVTANGALRGSLLGETLAVGPDARWTRGSGDQSNSLAFVNDRFVLKLFRRIEPGPNPEFEIARVLARRGFSRTPALVGALEYERAALEPSVIALVQDLVHHQGSGWDFIIDELGRYYERVAARGAEHASTLSIGRSADGRRLSPWRSTTTPGNRRRGATDAVFREPRGLLHGRRRGARPPDGGAAPGARRRERPGVCA